MQFVSEYTLLRICCKGGNIWYKKLQCMSIMSAENNNTHSMSDKDREMSRRFGNESKEPTADDMEIDDDDEETVTDKKDDKRAPKRALFFAEEQAKKASEKDKQNEPKVEKNILKDLFRIVDETEEDSQENNVSSSENQSPEDHLQDVVIDRLDSVESEIESTTTDLEAHVALADADFLEDVAVRLEEGMPADDAINDAYEAQLDPPEADASDEDLVEVAFFDEVESAPSTDLPHSTPNQNTRHSAPPLSPLNSNTIITPTFPMPHRTSSGRFTGTPRGAGHPLYPLSSTPSTLSTPSSVIDSDTDRMNEFYYRRKRGRDLLVGGVVGYMIGRRGGRKRTEAKFAPEIRRRDETIVDLRSKLVSTEDKVRELAKERISESGVVPDKNRENPIKDGIESPRLDVPSLKHIKKQIQTLRVATLAHERASAQSIEDSFAQTLTEAKVVQNAKSPDISKTERVVLPVIENNEDQVKKLSKEQKPSNQVKHLENQIERPELKRDIKTLPMPELLELAEKITLDKTNVKELFAHNRIDAVNVRRVVQEYLKGGNTYEKLLHGSLEAVEMQRELRNEQKHEDGVYKNNSTSSDDASRSNITPFVSSRQTGSVSTAQAGDSEEPAVFVDHDDRLMISTGTAIALGILTGIAVMVLIIVFLR